MKKALFVDMFSPYNLHIRRFTALVHYLKTGQSHPIKQLMRGTPLGFEQQDMVTLDQMLAACLIEPSHSKRASPPVLVHKRDTFWRYYIDFRAE